jgi:hypothetical protein
MEPHHEKPKVPKAGTEERKKRFRIVKLEERIAPSKGGGTKNCYSDKCSARCTTDTGTTLSIE